jgi:tetratricopeptide (TPR) repeat protein
MVFVDDVVTSLTGTETGAEGGALLREQMQRAADDFDEHTANAFGKALLESLCQDPSDVRRLEALLVLGLAHPTVLDEHRIQLAVEGRRLAVLLERSGHAERARALLEVLSSRMPEEADVDRDLSDMMRRTGSTAELVDRYLARAEQAVQEGRPLEAVPWLQQVLLLDRTRRDVARMIRDLRYGESERKSRVRRRVRVTGMLFVVSALVIGVFVREWRLEDSYRSLPPVEDSDLGAMQTRLASVEDLIETNKFWIGMFRAVSERGRLVEAIRQHSVRVQDRQLEDHIDRMRKADMAEAARTSGLASVDRGEFDSALEDFKRALDLAGEDWPHRPRVEADIDAIEAWQAEKR